MQLQMTSIFGDWLLERLKEKDMSQAELARAADISRASISDVISGRRNIGNDLAVSIARALRIPPEQIFRAAGILPAEKEANVKVEQIVYEVEKMDLDDQNEVLA